MTEFRNTTEIHRLVKESNFTVVSNELINDSRLEFCDIGVMVYLLSKPDGWIINQSQVIASHITGREAVRSSFKRLMEAGYMTRSERRSENGKFIYDYVLNEKSLKSADSSKLSQVRLTVDGLPPPVSRHLDNTEVQSTEEVSTGITEKDILDINNRIPASEWKSRNNEYKMLCLAKLNCKGFIPTTYTKFSAICKEHNKNAAMLANKLNEFVDDLIAPAAGPAKAAQQPSCSDDLPTSYKEEDPPIEPKTDQDYYNLIIDMIPKVDQTDLIAREEYYKQIRWVGRLKSYKPFYDIAILSSFIQAKAECPEDMLRPKVVF